MRDDKDDDLGNAPTTPAPEGPSGKQAPAIAAGSGPDSTIAMSAVDAAPDGEPGPGAVIGHFVVRRRLGAGGMGVVLACEDADLGRPAAVKIVREEHPAYRARLLREAKAMALLEHPNVVKVYEVGSDRGRVFIAMELVDGDTLTKWLAHRRPWREVVEMFRQVAAGLAAVHGVGLVHRDFKPDNVLVDRRGHARVADFGLARLEREEGEASPMGPTLTRTGAVMGTPGYMAPEQNFGGDVDARADQYSFCVALREALAGRPLDEARWTAVPANVRAAVARGLSYDASERFASMAALSDALRDMPAPKPRWIVPLIALAVLGAVTGVIAYVGTRDRGSTPVAADSPHDARVLAVDPQREVEATPPRLDHVADADAGAVPGDADVAVVGRVPSDAAVAVGVGRALRDAGVVAAARDARVAAAAAQPADASVAGGRPALTVIGPTTKGWPAAKVGDPAHLPVVRAALAGLGWDGFEASWSKQDLQQAIDAATGADRAIAQVKLGMLTRKGGNCASARLLFVEAIGVLKANEPEEQARWAARAWMGRALCSLAAGKADDADGEIKRAWVHGDRDELQLVMGFIAYEQGHKDVAYAQLLTAERKQKASVQAALKTWLDGLGLGLR